MSKEIKLNFYEEVISIPTPKAYDTFKANISKLYAIEPSDVDELIVYFFNSDKVKNFLIKEEDYNRMIEYAKSTDVTIFLEIDEKSKLYKQSNNNNNNTNINNNNINNTNLINNNNKNSYADQVKKEILEKEKLLKELIEKEKQEQERLKRAKLERVMKEKKEAEDKFELEKKKKRMEELKKKAARLQKEEEQRRQSEKKQLEKEVTKLMEENMEKMKKNLIQKTVNESMSLVDKQRNKMNEMSICKTVHKDSQCSGCGVSPIIGFRYKSPVESCNFELCENCEAILGDNHPYPLLKIRSETQGKMKFSLNNNKDSIKNNNIKDEDVVIFENLGNKK